MTDGEGCFGFRTCFGFRASDFEIGNSGDPEVTQVYLALGGCQVLSHLFWVPFGDSAITVGIPHIEEPRELSFLQISEHDILLIPLIGG